MPKDNRHEGRGAEGSYQFPKDTRRPIFPLNILLILQCRQSMWFEQKYPFAVMWRNSLHSSILMPEGIIQSHVAVSAPTIIIPFERWTLDSGGGMGTRFQIKYSQYDKRVQFKRRSLISGFFFSPARKLRNGVTPHVANEIDCRSNQSSPFACTVPNDNYWNWWPIALRSERLQPSFGIKLQFFFFVCEASESRAIDFRFNRCCRISRVVQ